MKQKEAFNSDIKEKILSLVYSVGAIGVFNLVLQLFIYPDIAERLGAEANGVALSMLSLVAIIAGACGTSANYSRMVNLEKLPHASNGDYNFFLLMSGSVCGLVGIGYLIYLGLATPMTILLYVLLMFFTVLRYYSDVEFRMKADFFRYMVYYLIISAGYLLGLWLFHLSGAWLFAILVGECLGVLYVLIRGTIYRRQVFRRSPSFKAVQISILLLLGGTLIENLTLHSDRLLLLVMTDGTSVTVYYAAALIGKVVALLTVPLNTLMISYLMRYKGKLTGKFWTIAVAAAFVISAVAFGACMVVSPWFIRWKYEMVYEAAMHYLVPALLGQIFYFVSGVLLVILLRFFGEKTQFRCNMIYAVEFFACVGVGTYLWGLDGFVWSCMAANLIRLAVVVIWGYIGTRRSAPTEETK